MTVRFYSSIAQQTNLSASITASTTVISVLATTGFPASTPFTLSVDYGQPNEELLNVTNIAGLSLTVDRATDGTAATTHNVGAIVRHVSSARDFADSRAHENASVGVHGLAGGSALVGTNDVQTLTNKTLTSPTINGTIAGSPAFSGSPTFNSTAFFSNSVLSQRALAANPAYRASVNADANDRFVVAADGSMSWGPGTAVTDVTLSRIGVGSLSTNGMLTIAKGLNVTSDTIDDVTFKASTTATGSIAFRWRNSSNASIATVDDKGDLLVNSLTELNANPWQSYAVAWTASTTNPTLGNGTIIGSFQQISKTVFFAIDLTFGSTTNPGSGSYSFSLPTTTSAAVNRTASGQAISAGGRVSLSVPIGMSSTVVSPFTASTSTPAILVGVTNTGVAGSPWTAGNFIRINGTYEAA